MGSADTGGVRVSFVDHSGCGLGVAIGLVELGHRVAYTGPESWPGDAPGETDRLARELIARFLGAQARTPDLNADLLVVWDGVADMLASLERGENTDARCDLAHPLRWTANPLIYPVRLECWVAWAEQASRTVVVDCSDKSAPREPALLALPRTVLLTRELPLRECGGPWHAFPFLYNLAMLWLEKLRPAREWLLEPRARRCTRDWVFCGTVEHPRYGDDRRRRLAEVRARWPARTGHVASAVPFVDVLALLQSARMGLDLPGAGEVCFRLHELLALGTPVLRPWPFGIVMPRGIETAIVTDPAADVLSGDLVRATHTRCYATHVAASALLASVQTASGASLGQPEVALASLASAGRHG